MYYWNATITVSFYVCLDETVETVSLIRHRFTSVTELIFENIFTYIVSLWPWSTRSNTFYVSCLLVSCMLFECCLLIEVKKSAHRYSINNPVMAFPLWLDITCPSCKRRSATQNPTMLYHFVCYHN